MGLSSQSDLQVIKKPKAPNVLLLVIVFICVTSYFLFSTTISEITWIREIRGSRGWLSGPSSAREKSLTAWVWGPPKPLTLSYPKLDKDSSDDHVEQLLRSVNGTLLGNPQTSKPFILFRAIGNDLPPRHAHGQAYENMRFMLENEKTFDDLDVRWYLNRILNQSELLRIVQLLVRHNQTFMLDRFDSDEFHDIDVNLFGFRPVDVLRANFFYRNDSLSAHARREIRDRIFAPMNHFIVHNNQARNKMISLGLSSGARYILPWDGNCFLTQTAWKNISQAIRYIDKGFEWNGEKVETEMNPVHNMSTYNLRKLNAKYFYVPMVRITDNMELLNKSYVPSSIDEEPQLIFRHDAELRFNESLPYGCRPKVQLLWRLRVWGWWQKRHMHPSSCMTYNKKLLRHDVPLKMRIAPVGWVARLFSGVAHLEVDGAIALRGGSRSDAIEAAAARAVIMLAEQEMNLSTNLPLLYDTSGLNRNINLMKRGDEKVRRVASRLLHAADSVVMVGKNMSAKNISLANPLPHVERLREGRNMGILTLAAIFSGDKNRIRAAIEWGHYLFSSLSPFDSRLSIEGGVDSCIALDSVRLLKLARVGKGDEHADAMRKLINESESWAKIRAWALTNSTLSIDSYYGQTWRSTLHDVHAACVGAFIGDAVALLQHTSLARGRMLSQFRSDDFLWRDGLRGIVAWTMLADLSERSSNIDLWDFTIPVELLREEESTMPPSGVPLLPNATKAILALAEHAARQRLQLGIPGGLGGLHSRSSEEEVCALHAVTLMAEQAMARRNIDLWRDSKRPASIPKHALLADVCIEDRENFIVPFWNLCM